MKAAATQAIALLLLVFMITGCTPTTPESTPEGSDRPADSSSEESQPQLPPTSVPEELFRRLAQIPAEGSYSSSFLGEYDGAQVYIFRYPADAEASEVVEETIGQRTFYNEASEPYPLAIYATKDTKIYTLTQAFSEGVISPSSLQLLQERMQEFYPDYYGVKRDTKRERALDVVYAVTPELDSWSYPQAVPAFMTMAMFTNEEVTFEGYDLQQLQSKYGADYAEKVSPVSYFELGAKNIFGADVVVEHRDMPQVFSYDAQCNVYVNNPTGGIRFSVPYISQMVSIDGNIEVTAFYIDYPGEYESFSDYGDDEGNILGKLPNRLPLTQSQAEQVAQQHGLTKRLYTFAEEEGRLVLKQVQRIEN